jgi:hypothetical protein
MRLHQNAFSPSLCICVLEHVYTCTYMALTCACIHMHIHGPHMCMYTRVHTWPSHVHVYTCTYMALTCACIHMYIHGPHMCMYTRVHTWPSHVHVYTCTYMALTLFTQMSCVCVCVVCTHLCKHVVCTHVCKHHTQIFTHISSALGITTKTKRNMCTHGCIHTHTYC